MKKATIIFAILFVSSVANGQTTPDIFKATSYEYYYLGIDYSHAKFIGDFTQFGSQGEVDMVSIKGDYFTKWNYVVFYEKEKYAIGKMLRKENITYDIADIIKINADTKVEEMEASYAKELKMEDIQSYLSEYDFTVKEGIGFLFIAEYLNKYSAQACFHFVAIKMETHEILLHGRFTKPAGGFGLRNYWISPVYRVIKDINRTKYRQWKSKYYF